MNYNTIFKTWEKNLYLEAKNSNYDNLKTIRDNRKNFFILSVWYYIILRNIHVWQHMVTSHFQLSMEWSKYKYIFFYRNKCCKDSIDTGKFTANHKESNIYIRNLLLNEIPLLYHYRSCNFAHCPPFCTIRQLTYIHYALISAKMNRFLTLVYKGYLTTHFPRRGEVRGTKMPITSTS